MSDILGTHKLLKLSLMALAFTPLVVTQNTLYPFIFGKISFIRLIVAIFTVLFSVYLWKVSRGNAVQGINFRKLINPIFITFLGFTALNLLSVLFAANPYVAFFGNIERGEGFVILLYMLIFLAGTILLFEKRDWLIFFKLVFIVGIVIALDIDVQYIAGRDYRPDGIFLGNPTFVATYQLFSIFSALLVAISSKNKWWKVIGYGSIPFFVFTIFATRTRGALLGLIVSIVVIGVEFIVRQGFNKIRLFNKDVSLRRLGLLTLIFIVLLSGIFISTRLSPIWQRIPGLDRLAQISTQDISTQTRLINLGPSLRAIDPREVGLGRTLIGWGPDNFNVAYEKFYNPHIQKYELEWFDRAHNKLLDVLVMNGAVGLLVYLIMWFYIFRYGFARRKIENEQNAKLLEDNNYQLPIVFLTTAYFVQNLFVFDQIATYIPFFALLGFIAHRHNEEHLDYNSHSRTDVVSVFSAGISSLVAIVTICGLIWLSVIPYRQMGMFINGRIFSSARQGFVWDPAYLEENLDKIAQPINYAQAELRERLLLAQMGFMEDQRTRELSFKIVELGEEVAWISSSRPKAYSSIGFMYTRLGEIYNSQELLLIGEENFKKSLELAPGRQETMFHYANNLVSQGRIEEAIMVADNMVTIEPDGLRAKLYWIAVVAPGDWDDKHQSKDALIAYYNEANMVSLENNQSEIEVLNKTLTELSVIRSSYNNYLSYFFRVKDSPSFLKMMRRSLVLEETVRSISQNMVSLGILSKPMEDGVEYIEGGIRAFTAQGWDAVSS